MNTVSLFSRTHSETEVYMVITFFTNSGRTVGCKADLDAKRETRFVTSDVRGTRTRTKSDTEHQVLLDFDSKDDTELDSSYNADSSRAWTLFSL